MSYYDGSDMVGMSDLDMLKQDLEFKDAEIARLTAELENWRKRGASVVANVAGLVKEVDRLKADNAKLIEALKAVTPELKEWLHITGFGETHRSNKAAVLLAEAILKEVL